MSITTERAEDQPVTPAPAVSRAPKVRAHMTVAAAALGLAFWVTHGLWADPTVNVVGDNVGDQAFFEWVLAYGVYVLEHGANPFYTTLMNAPHGVNLAANTSVTVYAIVFAPLTILAGPPISFLVILTLNLAGSAFGWYLFFGHYLVRNRLAAALAGLFCGFAPGMISHANGHLNWTSAWIAPLVLWRLFKLREPDRYVRNGILLGLCIAMGFTIAAEGLFFVTLAAAVFVVVWSLPKATRAEARAALPQMLGGLGVTALVAIALLAYPLHMHFSGPETFGGTGFSQQDYSEDVLSYIGWSHRSLAGAAGMASNLAPNPTEETSFFGIPLVLLIIVAFVVVWRRSTPGRRSTLLALLTVAVVFMVVSFGPRLQFFGDITHIHLPYEYLGRLPLFDAALPARFALVLIGVFGVMLALLAEQVLDGEMNGKARGLLAAFFAIALVPVFPLGVKSSARAPEPRFIADGTWKDYVPDNGVMTALPFAINMAADAQRWQAYTMARGGKQFRIPDGYFLGPESEGEGAREGKGRIGPALRRTDWLFLRAAYYGDVVQVSNDDRAAARDDFSYWGVDALFLPDRVTGPSGMLYRSALEMAATDLLGPPEHVDDVLVWRVRRGVDPVDREG